MKTINSEVIKSEVKEKLKIFFESNKVDDSLFYPVFKYVLSKFRIDIFPIKSTVLEVFNKEVKLPDDFKLLKCALACHTSTITEHVEPFTIDTYEIELCESHCGVCKDDCGNMFNIVQRFPTHTMNWTNFDLLCPTKTSLPSCDKDCFNFKSKSKNEIDLRNGKMYTNFQEGLVYIEYRADLEDDMEFEFPDNPTVIEWIKAELIHEIFQTLYYNGEKDIERRYRDAKNDAAIKYMNAHQIINRSEYSEYYKSINNFVKRYQKMSNIIW